MRMKKDEMGMETLKDKIINFLNEKKIATVSEISRGVNKRREYVRGYIQALNDMNVLELSVIGHSIAVRVREKNEIK